jgi:hypothetical protein
MKKYRITTHKDGITVCKIIEARSRREAYQIAWSMGYDDVYVSEVADNE